MEFIRHNKKLFTMLSVSTIGLMLLLNILYFIFAPIQSQGDPENFVATPILESKGQTATSSATVVGQPRSPLTLIGWSILLVIVLLLIVIVLATVKYQSSQKHARDKKRKQDLMRIAQGFEAYHQEHGQYPLSTTYLPQYYTGVNLSNDWNYYGLPDKEHMVRYLPDWPISDPSIDYHAKHQVNQYIYYPKDNGQKFNLYAHLEAPGKDEQIDYNQQDNLLRSWGNYNYRISNGQSQPSEVQPIPHPNHAKNGNTSPVAHSAPPTPVSPVATAAGLTPAATEVQPQQAAAQQATMQQATIATTPDSTANVTATLAGQPEVSGQAGPTENPMSPVMAAEGAQTLPEEPAIAPASGQDAAIGGMLNLTQPEQPLPANLGTGMQAPPQSNSAELSQVPTSIRSNLTQPAAPKPAVLDSTPPNDSNQ